jgi:hypothetical protein
MARTDTLRPSPAAFVSRGRRAAAALRRKLRGRAAFVAAGDALALCIALATGAWAAEGY